MAAIGFRYVQGRSLLHCNNIGRNAGYGSFVVLMHFFAFVAPFLLPACVLPTLRTDEQIDSTMFRGLPGTKNKPGTGPAEGPSRFPALEACRT
jgi:hypothetical protein